MKKKTFNTKIFDIVSSVVETVVAISLIVLIILVGFQRFSTRGNLFGFRIYTVASGSMIPTYNIGDTLLIKEMSSENIKVGDAVTYMGETGGVDGLIITHQVQQVDIDENGKYSFHTKGIANNIEDPIVYEEQVLGKVVHKFFILSIIGRVTTSMPLLFAFVAIPVAILIAIEIIKIVYKSDDDDDEDEDEEIEEVPVGDSPEEEEEPVPEEKEEEVPVGPVVKSIKVVEDTSMDEPFIVKMPTRPIEEKPVEEKPKPEKKEVPKKQEQPKKEEVKKETPKKEEPKKEKPKPVEFKKEDLTKEEFIEELKKEMEQVEEQPEEKKHRRRRRRRK